MQEFKKDSSKDWWLDFYEDSPFELFLNSKEAKETDDTIDFLIKHLEVSEGDLVFDQCCGNGEISFSLAKEGINVTGVDLCHKYIEMAETRCAAFSSRCRFYQGDAFQFKPDTTCDAAINWWTSFGYSEKSTKNLEMLKRAFESLKPGGRFALDYPNIPKVLRANKQLEEYEYNSDTDGGIITIQRKTTLNLEKGLREQRWIFHMPDGRELIHDTFLKMYLPDWIADNLEQCGFEQIKLFGSIFDDPLELDSERCIFVARRPKD